MVRVISATISKRRRNFHGTKWHKENGRRGVGMRQEILA
jgi:hypothetical protein